MKRNITLGLAATFGIVLCVLFGGILLRYTRPMPDTLCDLSMSWEGEALPDNWVYDQKGWRVFSADGPLSPDGFGSFFGPIQPEQTFFFSRVLSENMGDPTLRIDAYENSIAVFLDDILLYSDHPELSGGIGELSLPPLGWYRDTPVVLSLPASYLGKTLTIAQSSGLPEVGMDTPQTFFYVTPCNVTLY